VIVHELTPAECRDVLTRSHLGRLACARAGQPYVIPISFDFDGEHVYSFATLGQKVVWMRDNPLVCLEVDDIVDKFNWTTVVVFGRYQELKTRAEHLGAKDRARELFELREEWWQPAAAKTQAPEKHVPIVYRITIDRISGRRATRQA
jgi:nitroimidazol reductase NimA-like FMN-containing flavoprotein (pyridoxamine 5'-phosphate oxidase superfamily)